MSSRFHIRLSLIAIIALAGCQKKVPQAPVDQTGAPQAAASGLIPGSKPTTAINPNALPYLDNIRAVMEGKRLYNAYNCVGCHANGGGAIGPALMDDQWIYGGRVDQIYATIYQGRPNGMPAWGHKIPDPQIWQIAAYVRSMSLPGTTAGPNGTPSQNPVAVPRDADQNNGWTMPAGTGTEGQ